MAKKTNNKNTTTANTDGARIELDWNTETEKMQQAAKEKPGSRGDWLGKVAGIMSTESPASLILREAASRTGENRVYGAQAVIELSRNVLSKLPKLAQCVASGTAYCSHDALSKSRTEDASVPVALTALGAGNVRQKAIVADASGRYAGGGNAQMPAALGALEFFGIVQRKQVGEGVRNAEYEIIDTARADALLPKA